MFHAWFCSCGLTRNNPPSLPHPAVERLAEHHAFALEAAKIAPESERAKVTVVAGHLRPETGPAAAPTAHAGRYLYFRVDDSFKRADAMLVDVEVEYFDQGSGSFRIEYDGLDLNAPFNGTGTANPTMMTLADSQQWTTATFRLTGARFLNSQMAARTSGLPRRATRCT